MRPSTRYARSGDLNIAYQVVGDGPVDLIYVPGWVSNLDHAWEFPRMVHVFERLSRFARLILFDKRGTGLSDRNVGFPTLEQRMQDVQAVMDAAGSRRAVLMGTSEGGNMCMLFAATYPERTVALVLNGSFAKGLWAQDYPWAKTAEQVEQELAAITRDWGGAFDLSNAAPSLAQDREARDWLAAYLRNSASPQDAIALWRWNTEIDVRDILGAIHVPTLVLHRRGDRWVNVEEGRFVADRIEGAKWMELPGDDHVIWAGDADRTLDEIEEFVTGIRPEPVSRAGSPDGTLYRHRRFNIHGGGTGRPAMAGCAAPARRGRAYRTAPFHGRRSQDNRRRFSGELPWPDQGHRMRWGAAEPFEAKSVSKSAPRCTRASANGVAMT